jgi:hypothetical protein
MSVTDENINDVLPDEEFDSLFGGEKLPSLFDKTHGAGTTRTGIISKAPEDRQSRFFKDGGVGQLKYWGKDGKPTAEATNLDGTKNRPCMDTVFVLDTEYRLNPAELDERGMDSDEGKRGVFASGALLQAIKGAIKESGARKRADLVGARLTITRTGKTQKGDFRAWTWAAKLELGVRLPAVDDSEAF